MIFANSLRARLLFWGFSSMVALTVLAAAIMLLVVREQQKEVQRDMATLYQRLGSDMNGRIEATQMLLRGLANVPALGLFDSASCRTLLGKVIAGTHLLRELYVVSPGGDLLCGTAASGRGEFDLTYPALHPNGMPLAVIHATLDLDWMGQHMGESLPAGTSLTLFDDRGTLFYRSPATATKIDRPLQGHPILQGIQNSSGLLEATDLDEVERFFLIAPLAMPGHAGTYIAIGVATADGMRHAWFMIGLIGFTLLVAIALLAFVLRTGEIMVLRPLRDLTEAVRQFGTGQTQQKLEVRCEDELGRMATEFNRMIDAVNEREQAVMLSEVRTGLIFETAPDALLIVDAAGQVTRANSAAEQIFGMWRTDLMDCNLTELLPDMSPQALEQRETELHAVQVMHRSDNRPVFVDVRFAPHDIGTERLTIVALRDVTERRQFEERLMQAEKLEAIGQLTGGLAHDFNNILGIILGGLDLLEMRISGDEKARKNLELSRRAARRGAEITRSLLAVARRQTLEPRNVDIRELLHETLPLIRQLAGSNTEVPDITCMDPSLEACKAAAISKIDPGGLSNALINLVINARDAMPDGGRLTIQWACCPFDKSGYGLPPGKYIIIRICDTGHGIAPEHVDRIFEPFFTTKDRGKGTGLGLAMVFGFARQSGGTITVDSTVGNGTCFTLYMPAATDGVVAEAEIASEAANELPAGIERILLVDDEIGLLEVAEQWLTSLGYAVTVTPLPEVAVRLLGSEHFDMLITDVVMPGALDGLALAAKANRVRPGMPVLLASAFAKGLDAGNPPPWPLLAKPYTKTELAQRVRRMIDEGRRNTPA